MYHQTARRLVLILVAAAATTACGPVEVSPLADYTTTDTSATPGPASSTATDSTPAPTSATPTTDSTPAPRSASPSQSNTCVGSTFSIDGADSADSPKSLCFNAGGVLRIENVYPGDVSASPSDKVTCAWEAGIATCRFLRAGNATVRIAGQSPARSIEVVVV